MPLSPYIERIQSLFVETAPRLKDWPLASLFRSGLKSLQVHSADYDALVDERNPFYAEFINCARSGVAEDGDWFNLFECMVIFIRMRQMASQNQSLSPEELAVLEYFEKSDEWNQLDDKVVCNWYWHLIPRGGM